MTPEPGDASVAASRIIPVAAGLVFHEGRLLITRRPPGSHLAGCWEFPGGKREPGETWESCLRRELLEEVEIEVAVGRLFSELTHVYPEKTVYLRFFVCRWVTGTPRAVGCSELKWVTAGELAAHEFPPADREILLKLSGAEEFVVPRGKSL